MLFDSTKLNLFTLTNHNALSDRNRALVSGIESLSLSEEEFDHEAHVQLAWTYLRLHPAATAFKKCCQSIQGFATHLGATDKFHVTITLANFLLVANSMSNCDNTETWPAFKRRNTELFKNPMELIYHLYTHERLNSPEARTTALAPNAQFDM